MGVEIKDILRIESKKKSRGKNVRKKKYTAQKENRKKKKTNR